MLSILKKRKNFKDLKKTLKVVKIGKNFDIRGWGGDLLLARIYTPDGIPKNL